VDHEYVLGYSLNRSPIRGRRIDRSDFANPDNDPRGPYVTDPLTGKATGEDRPNLHFTIKNPETSDEWEPDPARGWITDKKGIMELLSNNLIWWPPNPRTGKPRKKRFLSETSERMPASSFWPDIKGQSGADEVDQMLGERLFAFPKSLEFMRRIVDLGVGADDIILDSTAGSGTTAHAILAENAADKGNRRFILIQMPYDSKDNEKAKFNICERVTSERVRRAILGYKRTNGDGKREKVEGLGGSFTYARVGPVLFGEYGDLGNKLPKWEEVARYIFYTETSRECDPKQFDEKTGFIGETEPAGGTSYYLLYTPNDKEDRQMSIRTLNAVLKADKNRNWVIYCEKIWIHPDEQAKFESEHKKKVRTMVMPFNLK